jgi:hypothetical protein
MAAATAAAAIQKGIQASKQNKASKAIKPVDPTKEVSPYAKAQYGLAQQYMNGRMAGAQNLEQGIMASQANMMNGVGRNATDSSQALAMLGAAQGQTNQSLSELQNQELQNKYNMLNNFNMASSAMTSELDKVHGDKLRRYEYDMARKNALKNAAMQNTQGAILGIRDTAAIFAGGNKGGGGDMGGNAMGVMSQVGTQGGNANFQGPANLAQYQQFNTSYQPSWLKQK